MTQGLVDPQLQAFYDANPEILADPSILAAEPLPQHGLTAHERSEMELAVAFLVMAYAVSRTLATQPPPVEPAAVAGQAWRHHAPLWAQLAVPAIIQAYDELPISDSAKQQLAEDYADTLGDYLNESSADALAAGYNQQLSAAGGGQTSWVRSVTAYGCDTADTRGIIAGLIAGAKSQLQGPITAAAKVAIQKARVARADLMGQTEARTASEAAKAVMWIAGQQDGTISASAVAVWRTHEHEHDCPICGPMDGVARPIGKAWQMPDGRMLWAACAHPHCQCHGDLVDSEPIQKDKDGDPYDRDTKGRFADREYRTRNVTRLAYADPEATAVAAEVVEAVKNPFGVDVRTAEQRNPFLLANPFKTANPFKVAAANPFLESENPFLAPLVDESTATTMARGKRKVINHVFLGVKRQGPAPEPKHETHYFPAMDAGDFWGTNAPNLRNGEPIDFDEINDYFTENSDDEPPGRHETIAYPADSIWESVPPQVEDIDQEEWDGIMRSASVVWHTSMHHVDSIVPALSDYDVQQIFARAGYSFPRPADEGRQRIAEHVLDNNSPDRSLEEAYADYITFERPELAGNAGESLMHTMAALFGDSNGDMDFSGDPPVVFSFDQGMHEDSPYLQGNYEIAHTIYHSAIASFGDHPPLGMLHVVEHELEPVGKYDTGQFNPDLDPDEIITGDKHPWD